MEIKHKRLNCLGTMFKVEQKRIPKMCLRWNPPSNKDGKTKMTLRKSIEVHLIEIALTWEEKLRIKAKYRASCGREVAIFFFLFLKKRTYNIN